MKNKISIALLVLGGTLYAQETTEESKVYTIDKVELFGEKNKQPEGLEEITRLPLKPRDQIQSISVISHRVIEELGGLTVTDVVKNIPGVIQFGSYGGVKESMSVRGYRGVPVLKNGVLMDSDFRTGSMLTDMQGIESIQVIKGSAAVTQGIGDGLGAAGGVINMVTKTPRFINQTQVGMRYGSWDFYRPTVDFQRVLDKDRKVAVRFNGAFQDSNSFRKGVQTNRIYVNPSVALRADEKTTLVVEMDYMNNHTTPDRGTVNLAGGDVNALYEMPKGKFLGFRTDDAHTETFNYSITANRQLSDKWKVRTAYMGSSYTLENTGAALSPVNRSAPDELRNRTLGKSHREDINQVLQVDLIGQGIRTGFANHIVQLGVDWKQSEVLTTSYKPKNIDQINVLEDVSNTLPEGVDYTNFELASAPVRALAPTVGFMVQDVVAMGKFIKMHLGLRYSKLNGRSGEEDSDAWNPALGVMFFPKENINIFGSYTTTTSLRSAANPLQGGGTTGPSSTRQWETGIKSDWLDEKLRVNLTLFDINTSNLSYSVLDQNGNATGYYDLAGSLNRKGLEVEVIGRISPELQVMTGWAYLDAKYQDSPAYVNGSAPMNSPNHTANGWLNYRFSTGALRGMDIGAGIYYVGERPVDDFTQKTFYNGHVLGVEPGVKPFLMKAYTTVDAQVGYQWNSSLDLRVFFNNIFDEVGYNSYFRGGYIDQILPRHFSAQISYKF
ncbi:TonB-dependent siderophore receptor [Planobacterium oryzisoli]|uniref:TonB-dependent siderophore receptor n=1 Tax=Planobacterium oryzisoli TaxID=2771435 RepID=A0A930YUW6_9FLAO|nr:TonB-dependent siderophore receptor [Planobacterium oryzisoli]MBF5026802.1 TonB-dependent siderophore receptor [Planobacterium oryzisoli]